MRVESLPGRALRCGLPGVTTPRVSLKLLFLFLALISISLADEPICRIELKRCASFEVLGLNVIDVYPVSAGMRKVVAAGSRKTIRAADYAVGIRIATRNPQRALQDIVRQIYDSTGRPLGKFMNSALEQIAPVTMLMAADADSVWFLVLTPRGEPDVYTLTCAYLIDEKKG